MRADSSNTASASTQVNTQRLALDAQGLDALRFQAKTNPDKALRQAAQQFESVFLNMLLKSMRDASPKDGLFDSEASQTYNGMLDQQWVDLLSKKGVGLADAMVKQLERNQQAHGKTGGLDPAAVDGKALPLHPTPQLKLLDPSRLQGLQSALPAGMEKTWSTLERINASTQQGAQQMNDANSPARHFVQSLWREAKQAEQATGVPAQFILGQAALESGWGKREIRTADGGTSYNLFGIKASGDWKGKIAESVTTEYVNGAPRKTVERFRAYGSYAEAFADYGRLLSSHPRYAQTLAAGQNAAQFATQLQKAGYATDPNYAEKLTQVIHKTMSLVA